MDGFHDLGGFQGFGKIPHTINSLSYKTVFKEDWEHLAYSLMFVAADHLKQFSIDEARHAVERLDVRQQVGTTYYERYVIATATLLVEAGVITQDELDQALGSPFKLANPPHSQGRPAITGRSPFEVGDRVVVRDEYVAGHVRMPGYVRGKEGVIRHRTTEQWPFPDTIGHGDKRAIHQPSYHVEFRVKDLWGDANDNGLVVVDLFESYLDKVVAEQTVTA
ncbi:nitrile hydratase subunit beta [Pseudomonas sp. TH03]|uniref:nitrile hydratase subunit beta n=1 Tax=Pseudomonas sp. TH03 TaxID=2796369 RepID=UPI0019141CAE|nr:nitrile hydratase subunit beta [Pseudomonas sp. TH03]MBK5549095.1 nitrile hydratase subunit beta [Pseudomonas sp. TH03]